MNLKEVTRMTNHQKYRARSQAENAPRAWDQGTIVGKGINGLLEGNRELRKQAKAEARINHDLIEAANGMVEQYERIYDLYTQSQKNRATEISDREKLISELAVYGRDRQEKVLELGDKHIGLLLAYDLLQEMYQREQVAGIENLALEQLQRLRESAQANDRYTKLDHISKQQQKQIKELLERVHRMRDNNANLYDELHQSEERRAGARKENAYLIATAKELAKDLRRAYDQNTLLEQDGEVAKSLANDLRKAYDLIKAKDMAISLANELLEAALQDAEDKKQHYRILAGKYDQLDESIVPLEQERNGLRRDRAKLSHEIVQSQQNQERAGKEAQKRIQGLEQELGERNRLLENARQRVDLIEERYSELGSLYDGLKQDADDNANVIQDLESELGDMEEIVNLAHEIVLRLEQGTNQLGRMYDRLAESIDDQKTIKIELPRRSRIERRPLNVGLAIAEAIFPE